VTLRGIGAKPDHPVSLGKYRIVEVLGEGGMGVVYRAHDAILDRQVAIKVIRKGLLAEQSEDVARRFRTEAMAAGRLSHPNIVTVFDYGEDDQTAFIVMELATGDNLADCLARVGQLPFEQAVGLTLQMLDGLHYAHERGIVHRDVKPSNMIIVDGRIKLTDFGVARILTSKLTQAGVAIGTPSYMAPEQLRGADVDGRVDVFAAGIVLFEMCTGVKPFDGETLDEVAYKICHVDPPAVSTIAPGVPEALDAVVAFALAKERDRRFATANDFARAVAGACPPHAASVTSLARASVAGAVPVSSPSREDLERVIRALAVHVGPIARVLVKRANTGTRDLRQLCQALGAQLSSDQERDRFRRDVGVA
jgi:eukaryotic-like serine/threonine-protein kinase